MDFLDGVKAMLEGNYHAIGTYPWITTYRMDIGKVIEGSRKIKLIQSQWSFIVPILVFIIVIISYRFKDFSVEKYLLTEVLFIVD